MTELAYAGQLPVFQTKWKQRGGNEIERGTYAESDEAANKGGVLGRGQGAVGAGEETLRLGAVTATALDNDALLLGRHFGGFGKNLVLMSRDVAV